MTDAPRGYKRRAFRRIKLKWKVPAMIAVPVVVITLAVALTGLLEAQKSLRDQRDLAMGAVLQAKTDKLNTWFDEIEQEVDFLRSGGDVRQAFPLFNTAWSLLPDPEQKLRRLYMAENPNPPGQKDLLADAGDGSSWSDLHARFHPRFRRFQRKGGYYDLFLIDTNGDVVYSVFKEPDFASNLLIGPYADSGLARAFRTALTQGAEEFSYSGFGPYAPSGGTPANFIAAPVFDDRGTRLGVVALQINIDAVGEILAKNALLGETGQIYGVSEDGLALSASRFENGHEILEALPDLPQIRAALSHEHEVLRDVPGVNGNPVEAQSAVIVRGGQDWHLVVEQDLSEALAVSRRMLVQRLIETGVVTLLVLGIAFYIAHAITFRIARLASSIDLVAGGDYAIDVAETKTGDEIGDIARAFQRFKRDLEAGEQARALADRQSKTQAWVVDVLKQSLARLSLGDLGCQIHRPMGADYEELRLNFNDTVTALAQIVDELKINAEAIEQDVETLTEGADALAGRTENQAATLEETAAAMEQITSTVQSTAQGAEEMAAAIQTARDQALRGEEVRGRAVGAMGKIEDSSRQIAQIIRVIEDIAFQTNLLSLNAGVEAARAGDVGRGFAVVAAEVRALAQRSSDSAAEIRNLITTSNEDVSNGVQLVVELGNSMQDIQQEVGSVAQKIAQIAAGAREQAEGLSEINNGINVLDQVTQQNAGMVSESAQAVRALQEKAGVLKGVVARFAGAEAMRAGPASYGHRESPFAQRAVAAPPQSASLRPHADTSDLGWTSGDALPLRALDHAAEPRKSMGAPPPWQDF